MEALRDYSLVLLPASDAMLEAAVDRLNLGIAQRARRALLDTTRAICTYATEARDTLIELDLNPVILTEDGRAVAADALMVITEPVAPR